MVIRQWACWLREQSEMALCMAPFVATALSGKSLTRALVICAAIAVAGGCSTTAKMPDPIPPVVIDVTDAGYYEPPGEEPENLCVQNDKVVLVFDGGTVEYTPPAECDPLWRIKDRGDPEP